MLTKNPQKEEILNLIKNENRTPKSLSEEYNIPIQTIYTWMRSERKPNKSESSNKENEELKQKISELEETIIFYKNHIKKLDNYIDRLEKELEKTQSSELSENLENREKHRRIH